MDHSENDCLLVVIMTHGEKDGKLHASDTTFRTEKLWELFMGDNCKSLIGKPKIFFIQACRGTKHDKGAFLPKMRSTYAVDSKTTSKSLVCLPTTADQLILYSTSEGFVSIRNTREGAWLIQELCHQLDTNFSDDLLSILTIVSRKVAMKSVECPKEKSLKFTKQMPVIVSSLTKKIYFHRELEN